MRIGFETVENGEGQRDAAAVAALVAKEPQEQEYDRFTATLLAGGSVAANASSVELEMITRLGAARALLTQAGAVEQSWWNAERAAREIAAACAHVNAVLALIPAHKEAQ